MLIRRLDITNVRNLRRVELANLADINIFYGLNGSGKTSILESIHMLSLARSFRSHKLKPVITIDADHCVVFGEVDLPSIGYQAIGVKRSKKNAGAIKVGGRALKSVAELAEMLPLQVISSDTFRLLEGSPSVRRQFLDWGVFHVEHQFHGVWKGVQRCLKQRNAILRRGRIDDHEIVVWSEELARLGEELSAYRQAYFQEFIPVFERTLRQLTDISDLEISYYRGWDRERSLAEVLSANLIRERELGYTLNSPNKADLRLRYQGTNASEILSRGQQKLVVCALRVAQGYLLTEKTKQKCVFLIDDLPSELDQAHRAALCNLLEGLECQVFISCVDYKDIDDCWSKTSNKKLFHVEHGNVTAI